MASGVNMTQRLAKHYGFENQNEYRAGANPICENQNEHVALCGEALVSPSKSPE